MLLYRISPLISGIPLHFLHSNFSHVCVKFVSISLVSLYFMVFFPHSAAFMTPSPATYVSNALRSLGLVKLTAGTWDHYVQVTLVIFIIIIIFSQFLTCPLICYFGFQSHQLYAWYDLFRAIFSILFKLSFHVSSTYTLLFYLFHWTLSSMICGYLVRCQVSELCVQFGRMQRLCTFLFTKIGKLLFVVLLYVSKAYLCISLNFYLVG